MKRCRVSDPVKIDRKVDEEVLRRPSAYQVLQDNDHFRGKLVFSPPRLVKAGTFEDKHGYLHWVEVRDNSGEGRYYRADYGWNKNTQRWDLWAN